MEVVAQGCYDKFSRTVDNHIVPGITQVTINRIHRLVENPRLTDSKGNTLFDINFGDIDKVTTDGDNNDDTFEIFVPYGLPSVGS